MEGAMVDVGRLLDRRKESERSGRGGGDGDGGEEEAPVFGVGGRVEGVEGSHWSTYGVGARFSSSASAGGSGDKILLGDCAIEGGPMEPFSELRSLVFMGTEATVSGD